jgi:deoxyhypusine synthase
MLEEQERGIKWTPRKMIHRLGKEINHADSVLYWAYKVPLNKLAAKSWLTPVERHSSLLPRVDGRITRRHALLSHPQNTLSSDAPRAISLDIVADLIEINTLALKVCATGVIILGGGLIKHHICNANLMRSGADYAVYVHTSGEFDGSDAGASPEEAVSWGKIRAGAQSVKVSVLGVLANNRFFVMRRLHFP